MDVVEDEGIGETGRPGIETVDGFVRPLRPEDEAELRGVMQASLTIDAFPGFTSWDLDRELVVMLGEPHSVAVAIEHGVICGYVGPRYDDLTVHPEFRRRGHGRRLFEAGRAIAAADGRDEIQLYVPENAGAQSFATAMGLRYRSSLWLFALPELVAVPEPAFPAEFVARPFGPWLPVSRYVELANAAFVGHPGGQTFTTDEVEWAHAQPWFDAALIRLVCPVARPDEPVGFVRARIEPDQDAERGESGVGGAPGGNIGAPGAGVRPRRGALRRGALRRGALRRGEVALVGVRPEYRGLGLGRALLRWGVRELRGRGAREITLQVEARNERAMSLYREEGFEPKVEWAHWTCPVSAPSDSSSAGVPSTAGGEAWSGSPSS